MQCKFGQCKKSDTEVRLDGIVVSKYNPFKYLGLFQVNIIDEMLLIESKLDGWNGEVLPGVM